jgi:glycosyltransferase involved in cell wall biosynthesis
MIKIAIILADNVESSIRVLSEDISQNLPEVYSVDIFSIKFNCKKPTEHIKPVFKEFWKFKDYEIIHLQAAMPISLAPLIRLLFPKVKLISTEHDFGWNYFKNTLPLVKRTILRLSLYIGRLCCHKNTYPSFSLFKDVTGMDEINSRYAIIYNGIQDCSQNQNDVQLSHSKDTTKRVIVVGNYYYSKGIDLIMSIVDDMPDLEFHLFGNVFNGLNEEGLKSLQKRIENKNVIIHGKVDRDIFIEFLNQKKCVVCIPSRSEVCPLVAIEAMATSHPLVVSDIPVFYELTNEDVAVIFNLNDVNSLKVSLRHAFVDYKTFARNVRRLYLNNYTVNEMTNKYEKQYKEITWKTQD